VPAAPRASLKPVDHKNGRRSGRCLSFQTSSHPGLAKGWWDSSDSIACGSKIGSVRVKGCVDPSAARRSTDRAERKLELSIDDALTDGSAVRQRR